MKFINSLKSRVKKKVDNYVVSIMEDYLDSEFLSPIKENKKSIDKNYKDIQNTLKDIAYLADALKSMYFIIEENEARKLIDSDDDTTFH